MAGGLVRFSNSLPHNAPDPRAVYPGTQLKSFRGNAVTLGGWERGTSVLENNLGTRYGGKAWKGI